LLFPYGEHGYHLGIRYTNAEEAVLFVNMSRCLSSVDSICTTG